MPLQKRVHYGAFIENQEHIEGDWHQDFGDRKNEIVFIGQDLNETLMRSELEWCLATDEEVEAGNWIEGYEDEWPVEKAYPL